MTDAVDLARLAELLEALRGEVSRLGERVAALEAAARPPVPAPAAGAHGLSEEMVLVISAAIAAYLGKRPHIRQIRLLRSDAWAQQGRTTIQASHALSGPGHEEIALRLKITVDGKVYEVEVDVFEPEQPGPAYVPPVGTARVPAAAPAAPPPPRTGAPVPVGDESKVCRSPIAGTVAKVPIQVGQVIAVNDVLMVLEAMKMETVITAPIAGKVARINANVGDFVQGGQVLVEFE